MTKSAFILEQMMYSGHYSKTVCEALDYAVKCIQIVGAWQGMQEKMGDLRGEE